MHALDVMQMNSADSERMAGALELAGYRCTEEAEEADVLIYNTCSIREKAENKVYSALGKQVGTVEEDSRRCDPCSQLNPTLP